MKFLELIHADTFLLEAHLNRYLTNFDYRCPICRRDLRRENDVENPTPINNLLDLSSNLTILPTTENESQTRDIINNAVESVTNALMSNITDQITRDPSRNAFVAEYSFLLPQFQILLLMHAIWVQYKLKLTPNFTSTDTDTHMPELEDDYDL